MSRRTVLAGAAFVILLLVACGAGEETGSRGGGDASLSIASPTDGAKVSVPFTLEISSDVELGATDTGAHHVHVFFDGDDSNYEVVESDRFQVTELASGEHTVTASLRNADHSPAGAEDEITVIVTGAGGNDTDGEDADDDGDYRY
jgi:hypothetical protein